MHGSVYLVAGPDFGRREQAIKSIRERVEQSANAGGGAGAGANAASGGGVEGSTYYADDLPVAELVNRLYNRTLFHAHLLVVYRNVEQLRGVAAHTRLREYIRAPSEQATLILVSETPNPSVAWAKEIPQKQTVVCWQPFDNEITASIGDVFRTHQKRVSTEVIQQIAELCGNDGHLARQLSYQIVYFSHDQEEITMEQLAEHIDTQHGASLFHLTEPLFARNSVAAITALHRLHAEQFTAGAITGFVNAQLQKLWRISYLIANGLPPDEAMRKQGVRWKRQMRSFQIGLGSFPLPELSRLITRHKQLEIEIRELPESYAYLLLTRLILQVCAGLAASLVPAPPPPLSW